MEKANENEILQKAKNIMKRNKKAERITSLWFETANES